MRSLAERYAVLLREPGVRRFVALSFVMRLPLAPSASRRSCTCARSPFDRVRRTVVGAMLVAAAASAPVQGA